MKTIVTVVGLGPRGLNIIERLLAIAKNSSDHSPELELNIINPGDLGVGVHEIAQPESLLVNTVACQITMYTDTSVIDAGPIIKGPSFYTWARNKGYKYNEELRQYSFSSGREIQPNDYLPRSLFGKYLQWVSNNIIQELKLYCTVNIYQDEAVNIRKINATHFKVILKNNLPLSTNYLFLTTGHSTNTLEISEEEMIATTTDLHHINPNFSFMARPYPIAKTTKTLSSNITVAIEGFGLTATDIISELTIGKGGQFIQAENGRCRYIKSGQEPKLIMYSKSGLPFMGRATNQKGVSEQYKPTFFTYQNIEHLKQTFGIGPKKQLDFEAHVLPELIKEMMYCYYMTAAKNTLNPHMIEHFSHQYIDSINRPEQLEQLLNTNFTSIKKFDWNQIMDPTLGQAFESPMAYQKWMLHYLHQDLDACIEGNIRNPFKAACDVLRDIRDIIRSVIDFSGLTETSHQKFMRVYAPVMNRISVGPPKERIAELIALIESDVVDILIGKNPITVIDKERACFNITGPNIAGNKTRQVDTIIKARISAPLPEKDLSPLMKNLLTNGLVRTFQNGNYHPSGIDIDTKFHPINRAGMPEPSIWCMGTIAEGPKYYTYIVPRPGVNSTCLLDAGKAMLDLFANIKQKQNNTHNRYQLYMPANIPNMAVLGTILCFVAIAIGIQQISTETQDDMHNNINNAFN